MSRRRFAALLFLLALAVRLPMLASLRKSYLTGGISTSLGLVARNLLEGRGLSETTGPEEILHLYDVQLTQRKLIDIEEFPDPPDQPTAPLIQRMPGYPACLAAIWKLTGSYRYAPIQALQVLLSCLLPLLIYFAAARIFGEVPGRIAGVLACLNIAEARLAVVPLYDWWTIFVVGVAIGLLAKGEKEGFPPRIFALLGVTLAAGVAFKSTLLALPPFLAASLVPRIGWRRARWAVLLIAGIPALALLPWSIRNQRIFGRPILTNTFLWPSIWEGFGEVPNSFGAMLDDRRTYLLALAERPDLRYGSPEYDDYFHDKALSVMSERPGFIVSLWLRRLWMGLMSPGNVWDIGGIDSPESSYAEFRAATGGSLRAYLVAHPLVSLLKILQRVWDPLLVILAAWGLASERRRWREFLPYLAIPAAFLAVTIPIHLEGRYLLPGSLSWILFASLPLAGWIAPPRR